jgi:hypothetical protein
MRLIRVCGFIVPRNSSMAWDSDCLVKVPHDGRIEPISGIADGVGQGIFELKTSS